MTKMLPKVMPKVIPKAMWKGFVRGGFALDPTLIVNLGLNGNLIDPLGQLTDGYSTGVSDIWLIRNGVGVKYAGEVAGNDAEPCFDDNGLFNPGVATNICLQNERMDISPWGQTNLVREDNKEDIFDGTNGWLLKDEGPRAELYQIISIESSTNWYSAIFFMKKADIANPHFQCAIGVRDVSRVIEQIIINTKTLEVTETENDGYYKITDMGDWVKIYLAVQDIDVGNDSCLIDFRPAQYSDSYTGEVHVCYPQIFKLPYDPQVIIPTADSPVATSARQVAWTMGDILKDSLSDAEGSPDSEGRMECVWTPYFRGDELDDGDVKIINVLTGNSLLTTYMSTAIVPITRTRDSDGYSTIQALLDIDKNVDIEVQWSKKAKVLLLSKTVDGVITEGNIHEYSGQFPIGIPFTIGYPNSNHPFSIRNLKFFNTPEDPKALYDPLESSVYWEALQGASEFYMKKGVIYVKQNNTTPDTFVAYTALDAADVHISAILKTVAAGDVGCYLLSLRGADWSNQIGVSLYAGELGVWQRDGGTQTTIVDSFDATPYLNHRIHLAAAGDQIHFWDEEGGFDFIAPVTRLVPGRVGMVYRRWVIEEQAYIEDFRIEPNIYVPLEDSPEWNNITGTEDSIFFIRDRKIYARNSAAPADQCIAFGTQEYTDVELKCILRYSSTGEQTEPYFLAARMNDFENFVGVTVWQGRVCVYERNGGAWSGLILGEDAPLVDPVVDEEITLKLTGSEVEMRALDGVWHATTSVAGPGRVGVLSRKWELATGPFIDNFEVVV